MNARADMEREDAVLAGQETAARIALDRGQRARVILEDPLVIEALALMESKVLEAWKDSPASDTAARERLYHYQRSVQEFRRFFTIAVTNGKFAEKDIAHIRNRRGFLGFRLRRAS